MIGIRQLTMSTFKEDVRDVQGGIASSSQPKPCTFASTPESMIHGGHETFDLNPGMGIHMPSRAQHLCDSQALFHYPTAY